MACVIGQWIASLFGKQESSASDMVDFMPPTRKTVTVLYEQPWAEIYEELNHLGLKPMVAKTKMPDKTFYYTDIANWCEITPNLVFDPPDHFDQFERRDCDNFSKLASALCEFYQGLNFIQAWGWIPTNDEDGKGYHAFNMVKVGPNSWRVFEPNKDFQCSGILMPLDNEYNWQPVEWKP